MEPSVFTVWIGGPDWIRIGIQDGLLPRNVNLAVYDLGLGVEKHPQGWMKHSAGRTGQGRGEVSRGSQVRECVFAVL